MTIPAMPCLWASQMYLVSEGNRKLGYTDDYSDKVEILTITSNSAVFLKLLKILEIKPG